MDEYKSPEDILDEIMNRTAEQTSASTSAPTESGPPDPGPAEELPPPPETKKTARADLPAKFVGLAAGLAAIAILLLALIVKVNTLEQSIKGLELADSFRQENEMLKRENEILQREKEELKSDVASTKSLWQTAEREKMDYLQRYYAAQAKRQQLESLWYIGRFLDAGDYPMAAIVMVLGNESLRGTPDSFSNGSFSELNSFQQEQYDRCRDILVEAGYLYNSGLTQQNGTTPLWADGWDPSENPDMAALGILWCALEAYYIEGDVYAPMQYLITYYYTPLGGAEDDVLAYPQRLPNIAGEDTLRMYRQLIRDLCDNGYMVEEHGVLGYAPDQFYPDILYTLPFELPVNTALIPAGN